MIFINTSFDMIVRRFPDTKEICIVPISDVHVGSLYQKEKEWREFCNRLEKEPNTYITLGGDLVNNSVRNSVANPFDEVMRPREQKKFMVECLEPIKDKILCAVSGNHEARTVRDTDQDITMDILCKLDLEDIYREDIAYLKIGVGTRVDRPEYSNQTYCIGVTHGSGGGYLPGATINRNERYSYYVEGLDALCVGHTHRGMMSKPQRLVVNLNTEKITLRRVSIVSSESWLSYGGYAIRKMLQPSEIDPEEVQKIHLSGGRSKRIRLEW